MGSVSACAPRHGRGAAQALEENVVPLSNDDATLIPSTSCAGPSLEVDFPGLHIGVAEYDEGPTGCTVFHFASGAAAVAVDVRGGSPGVLGDYGEADAICLAGGSLYGLEAAVGVQAELFARRGYSTNWGTIALVSAAIIFDYRTRDNSIYPDKALGRAALRAARPGTFPLGPRGAGRSASVGKLGLELWESEPAGQGGAFRQLGPTKIAVFSVVNAVGAIVDRHGAVVRGCLDRATGVRHAYMAGMERKLAGDDSAALSPPSGNTTLTIVVTNRRLDDWTLRQVGRQVHSSMARAIQPFHCLTDGDVLFAATTNEVEDKDLDPMALGALASELAWDAVLTSFSG